MKSFLRRWFHALLRVLDFLDYPNEAQWKRLKKKGRIVHGPGYYSTPIVKVYDHDDTKLIIGNYTCISETAIIMLGGDHAVDQTTTYPFRIRYGLPGAGRDGQPKVSGDIHIGSEVWVGQRAFIRGGLTIGDGAIIASNAVVTKDVPPFAIMGGNPAKVIRYRHTEEQRAALLDIRWWDWPEDEILRAVPLLASTDVDAFIDYARRRFPDGPGTTPADVPAPHDPFRD